MRLQFLAFSGVMFALAIVVCVESATLVVWTPLGPGPGFFTAILGGVLAVLAVGVAWDERMRARRGAPAGDGGDSLLDEPDAPAGEGAEASASTRGRPERPGGRKKLLLVAAALIPIPFILEPLGFRLTIFALLAYLLIYVERRRPVTSLIMAVVVSLCAFYLFYDLLAVPLPLGLLGF